MRDDEEECFDDDLLELVLELLCLEEECFLSELLDDMLVEEGGEIVEDPEE